MVEGSFVVDAMICLEALLNEDPNNSRYKFSIRCAFILGLNGFDAKEKFKRLKQLYDLRSRIIHGSEKRTKIRIRQELIIYARRRLLSFYILCPNRIDASAPTKSAPGN